MAEALGKTSMNMLYITYCQEINVLHFRFSSAIIRPINNTWLWVTGKDKALARDTYGRDLWLKQRTQYVHTYPPPKVRPAEQFIPTPKEHERQNLTLISWETRRCAIFMFPVSTLHRQTEDECKDLIDVADKSRALFLTTFWVQGNRTGSLTAEWLSVWVSLFPNTNPRA